MKDGVSLSLRGNPNVLAILPCRQSLLASNGLPPTGESKRLTERADAKLMEEGAG